MFKQPQKSRLLQLLEILRTRKTLTPTENSHYIRQRQGYEGESQFAASVKHHLHPSYIVRYSVFLQTDNQYFQIDCLIIAQNTIYLLDNKYFKGDYYFYKDDFYLHYNDKRLRNPFHQLQRCEDLFRDFLKQHPYSFHIKSSLIFNHPEFSLYEAPRDLNAILPGQVNFFLRKLNRDAHHKTTYGQKLISLLEQCHIWHNHFEFEPTYEEATLDKGVFCLYCHYPMQKKNIKTMACTHCVKEEPMISAILRHTLDYHLLFPTNKITTKSIYHWCGQIISLSRVRSTLRDYLRATGKNSGMFYAFYERY